MLMVSLYQSRKNVARLWNNLSCTPLGIINLLEEYDISIKNKDITLIALSNIVGKPLGMMC